MPNQNSRARAFAALHNPGDPILLANVYDYLSASVIASIPGVKALATASYAIAAAQGIADEHLSLETNIAACTPIAELATKKDLFLTLDLQGGYGDQLEETIKRAIQIGAVGCNIEDSYLNDEGNIVLRGTDQQVARLLKAREYAAKYGVPDFVFNARTDVSFLGGDIDEATRRGEAYLQAGATNVFVWGGPRGVKDAEVVSLVAAFGGRLSVKAKRGVNGLSTKELAALGVARVSVGPEMMRISIDAIRASAEEYMNGGQLL